MEFMVYCWSLVLKFQTFGFGVLGLGLSFQWLGVRVQGPGSRVEFRVWKFVFGVLGSGFMF